MAADGGAVAVKRVRRMRRVGGTPVEQAPVWALALLAGVLWLVVFPALVGLLNGLRVVRGGGWAVAGAAAAVAVLLVVGLARQPAWKRPAPEDPWTPVPLFARFSTWLLTTLLVPNVLYGWLVLARGGEGLDYAASWAIGGLVALLHGAWSLVARWRRRRVGAA